MKVRLKPRSPFLTVEIDMPWEVAELIVAGGPGILKAIGQALGRRKVELAEDGQSTTRQHQGFEDEKAEWSALAARTEAEIARGCGPARGEVSMNLYFIRVMGDDLKYRSVLVGSLASNILILPEALSRRTCLQISLATTDLR